MLRVRALERFARTRGTQAPPRCELCAAAIGEPHPHVVELASRALRCACGACAVLFRDAGAGGGRWRTVPDRVAHDPTLSVTDAEWVTLGVPVRVACVMRAAAPAPARSIDPRGADGVQHRPAAAWTALFPSPAGPVEAELPEDPWRSLAARSRLVAGLDSDVETLLLRRSPGAPAECLVAPATAGHALCALVRRTWKGFSGGDEAARAIDAFFADLRARSRPLSPEKKGAAR